MMLERTATAMCCFPSKDAHMRDVERYVKHVVSLTLRRKMSR
jgi:hypothetical protein